MPITVIKDLGGGGEGGSIFSILAWLLGIQAYMDCMYRLEAVWIWSGTSAYYDMHKGWWHLLTAGAARTVEAAAGAGAGV